MTTRDIRRYYRFYGARHSILHLGYLIDFEIEESNPPFLPRLRSLSHLSFPWLFERERLLVWQRYIQKLEPHLRDTETLEPFYFNSLLESARIWHKQAPKRSALQHYVHLLEFEGRIYPPDHCFICEGSLKDEISIMTGLKSVHPECIHAPCIKREKIEMLIYEKSTLLLDENEVDWLFETILVSL